MPKVEIDGYVEDSKGRLVPKSALKEVDLLRDRVIGEILEKAQALETELSAFKRKVLDDIGAFVELSTERFGVKIGGRLGNVSLVSFNGKQKVVMAIAKRIGFDERLQAAKKLIDDYINELTADSSAELKVLVMNAFDVDREGLINTGEILKLRRYKFDDPRWNKAMEAIDASIQVIGKTAYVRFYERMDPAANWRAVTLDLAALSIA